MCVSSLFDGAGRVLLVKTPRRGWECPGGQVEPGEDLIEALMREVREESTCDVRVEGLVGICTNASPPEQVHFLFRGTHEKGTPRASDETTDADWFTFEALQLVTFPSNAARLRDGLACHQRPTYRVYTTRPTTWGKRRSSSQRPPLPYRRPRAQLPRRPGQWRVAQAAAPPQQRGGKDGSREWTRMAAAKRRK